MQFVYIWAGNAEDGGWGLHSHMQAGCRCQLSLKVFPGGWNPQKQIMMMSSDEITLSLNREGGQNPSQLPLYNATMRFESRLPLCSSITFPLVAIYDCVYVTCKDESSHVRFIIHRALGERPIAVYESCSNVLSGTSRHRCVFWPMWWQHDMKMDLFCAVEVQARGVSQPASGVNAPRMGCLPSMPHLAPCASHVCSTLASPVHTANQTAEGSEVVLCCALLIFTRSLVLTGICLPLPTAALPVWYSWEECSWRKEGGGGGWVKRKIKTETGWGEKDRELPASI